MRPDGLAPGVALATVAAFVICTAPAAQDPQGGAAAGADASPLARFVPADTAFVLQLDGPALMRQKFLATNLGTMLETQEAGDLWTALAEPLRGMLRVFGEAAGTRMSDRLDDLRAYRGRITVALDLTPHDQAWAGVAPDLSGVVILAPDGRTDLGALAERVGAALAESELRAAPVEAGGETAPAFWFDEASGLTAPRLIDEHVVVWFGEQLERSFAARAVGARGAAGSLVPDTEERDASVALRINVPKLLDVAAEDESWGIAGDVRDLYRVLGLSSVRDVRLSVRPDGPHVRIESSVGFREKAERGLFAALFSDSQEPPGLAGLVPPGTRYWQAGKLHPLALYTTIVRTAGLLMYHDESAKAIREQNQKRLGFDPGADVFARATGDCVVLGRLFGGSDDHREGDAAADDVGSGSGTLAFVFRIEDRGSFAKRWRTLVEQWMDTDLEVDEVAGVEVFSCNVWRWFDLSYALTDDVLFFAVGRAARDWIEPLIARYRQLDPKARGELPVDVRRLRRSAPDGFHGCAAFDVRHLLSAEEFSWWGLTEGVEAEARDAGRRIVEALLPLLSEHRLERATALAGFADSRWRYRVLW